MIVTRKSGLSVDRGSRIRLAVLLLGAALPPAALPAVSQCRLGKMAEFPITMRGMRPLMTVGINGTQVAARRGAEKSSPLLPKVLDSRGLVLLRMGEYG